MQDCDSRFYGLRWRYLWSIYVEIPSRLLEENAWDSEKSHRGGAPTGTTKAEPE
jgi:hypothetical protein